MTILLSNLDIHKSCPSDKHAAIPAAYNFYTFILLYIRILLLGNVEGWGSNFSNVYTRKLKKYITFFPSPSLPTEEKLWKSIKITSWGSLWK